MVFSTVEICSYKMSEKLKKINFRVNTFYDVNIETI